MSWEISSLFTVALDEKGRVRFNYHARNFFNDFDAVDVLYDVELESIGFSFKEKYVPGMIRTDWNSQKGRHLCLPIGVFEALEITHENIGKKKYFLLHDPEENIWYFSYNYPIVG